MKRYIDIIAVTIVLAFAVMAFACTTTKNGSTEVHVPAGNSMAVNSGDIVENDHSQSVILDIADPVSSINNEEGSPSTGSME